MLKILTTTEVMNILGVKSTTFIKMRKEHNFPQPIPLTAKGHRYFESDIENWLIERQRELIEKEIIIKQKPIKKKKSIQQVRKISFEEFELLNGASCYGSIQSA